MATNKYTEIQKLVRYSLLASITTLLQLSAIFFPGPGHILSAFTTLTVAIAAYMGPRGGIFCYVISTMLTFMLQPSELPLLALCTAPLGLILGWSLHYRFYKLLTVLAGTVILTNGLLIITFILGVPAFGALLFNSGYWTNITIYACFSFVYSYAWYGFVKQIIGNLGRFVIL